MFALLLSRLGDRQALVARGAQAAVTWGSHVLAGTVAEQAAELEELRARVTELTDDREAAEDRAADLEAAFAYLEVDPDEVITNAREAAKAAHPAGKDYPAVEDVDPLGRADDEVA